MSMYNDNSQQHSLYQEDNEPYLQFAELESHSDTQQFPASSSQIHPHPHPYPLFSRQENMNTPSSGSLDPHSLTSHHSVQPPPSSFATFQHQPRLTSYESPHGWLPYQQRVSQPFTQSNSSAVSVSYPPPAFPSPSPFPPTRLSPPPVHQAAHYKGRGGGPGLTHGSSSGSPSAASNSRLTLAGSLDPATGIFYRTPEHPRLRTAQACEKCRTRKAKCSGEHPSCKRCITRGLACEYAKEGRVRGPNKPKPNRNGQGIQTGGGGGVHGPSLIPGPDITSSGNTGGSGKTSRNRTSSIHSSSSSEHPSELSTNATSLRSPPKEPLTSSSAGYLSMPTLNSGDFSSYSSTLRRNSLSLSESRASRPRPPDLKLNAALTLHRLPCEDAPGLRDIPCTADPYLTYQQRYQDHQDQREVFSGVQLDPIQPPPFVDQQHHQLHSLPQRHDPSRSREVPQMRTQSRYSSDVMDQTSNVLMEPVQTHGLANYGVGEDPLMYLPSPETFIAHQSQLHPHQPQISHEQRTYEELLNQRASRWRDASSEVLSSSRTSATSMVPPSLTTTTRNSCLSSAHMSMTGSAGVAAATGSLASGRAASSSSGGGESGLGVGSRARMLMTDYSQRQHQPVLQSQLQANTELQFALDQTLCDPPPPGSIVNSAEGQGLVLCDDTCVQAQGNSQN